MGLFRSLRGSVTVELVSGDVPRMLQELGTREIPVYAVSYKDALSVRLRIPVDTLPEVLELCRSRGNEVRVWKRHGIYWAARAAGKRPLLWSGLAVFLLLYLAVPSRILFIEVEGNDRISAKQILEAAGDCGIYFGAQRRNIRSERVKNALLQAIPELQWAGVNTTGCVATICVREKVPVAELPKSGVCSIVAVRDGVIVSGTVTGGNCLFRIGEAVTRGQILISGYTDLGLTIRAERASGEVYAQTHHNLSVVMPLFCLKKGAGEGTHRNFGLILGKNRINLWKGSGIWEVTCDRIYEEYPVTLPGGFRLPISFFRETIRERETTTDSWPEETLRGELARAARSYVLGKTIAGQIQEQHHIFEMQSGVCKLRSEFVCVEMIGREYEEMMGE